MTKRLFFAQLFAIAAIAFAMTTHTFAQQQTRGIGIYPGAPEENYAPLLVTDTAAFRDNIARGRTVMQSSSFDCNMTGQMLTDGFVDMDGVERRMVYLSATTPLGELSPRERESAIDGNDWTRTHVMGSDTWLQYSWNGLTLEADGVRVIGSVAYRPDEATKGYSIRLLTSDDGKRWQEQYVVKGDTLPGRKAWNPVHSDPNKNDGNDDLLPARQLDLKMPFKNAMTFSHLRLELKMAGAAYWTFLEIPITNGSKRLENLLPSQKYPGVWMSAGNEDEWVTVDLGTSSILQRVALYWVTVPKRYNVEISENGRLWFDCPKAEKSSDHLTVVNMESNPLRGRYLRISMKESADGRPFAMSEIEVMGSGGLVALPSAEGGWQDGRYLLDGGDWRLQPASSQDDWLSEISSPDYDASWWTAATVPATALMSYVNVGAIPNPNYDDNITQVSEAFFNRDFWYRRVFQVPEEMRGKHVFLNFDGINWKADVYLNGQRADRIEGAFMRGRTDITSLLRDGDNVLVVLVHKNDHPGAVKVKNETSTDYNGGLLGADNPTFHATAGWDWITTIRGREVGIWDDVYLTASPTGIVLSDPIVNTVVDFEQGDTLATMYPAVVVTNHNAQPQQFTVYGWIGNIQYATDIILDGGEERQVIFTPEIFPQLKRQRMHLWWPNGYGEPYLYDCGYSLEPPTVNSKPSALNYKAGLREIFYDEVPTRLQVYVNHQRFVPMGGNWGFSENNLCYRGREYDAAIRYHRDMNLNCIRNWVGQIGDREFYEACDRYGIMVWQDFWLANPADGPDPYDNDLFIDNARDMVRRTRQHPSIMLYCGRNEGYPPKALDNALRRLVFELTTTDFERNPSPQEGGGGMLYISSSADEGVSGHGPYWALPTKEYFQRQTGQLHTERGMPNIMTYEGLSRTLRPEHLWPQNVYWGQHDFTMQGAQRGASFNELITRAFGKPKDAREFTTLAQWLNYDGYRAMYESCNVDRQGLLIWMSHPTWPSMVWQTYDYYLEPTAAYFGVKKACEPLHVQWNALTDSVEIVNRTAANYPQLTTQATLYDCQGNQITTQYGTAEVRADQTCASMQLPTIGNLLALSKVGFLRLRLTDTAGEILSENTYVCASDTGNYQALKALPHAEVTMSELQPSQTNGWQKRIITVKNHSDVPALMLRLNLKGDDGEQVLPVIYSDNYFHLMPGEERQVSVEWQERDARGGDAHIELSGYNL